jgi:GNAT superfamily N-acetyltransferase
VNRTQLAPDAGRAGGIVEIRGASAADCAAITSFVAGLSDSSRFLRFFTPAAPPASSVLRRMCGLSPATDVLVATWHDVIIGHAMAVDVTAAEGGRVADVGVVVTDGWQNRGVGSEMIRQVAARAAARGVTGLVMDVLPENRRMLAMIARRWADAAYAYDGGSVTVRVRLPGPPAARDSGEHAGLRAA